MAKFTCGICGNSFEREAQMAVCDGINTKADADGKPILDKEGNLIHEGEAHAPSVMKKGGAK